MEPSYRGGVEFSFPTPVEIQLEFGYMPGERL
jgi:hypothetical protein